MDPARARRERMRRAAETALRYGADPSVDGRQALIDLALARGERLHPTLVASLEAQGYTVPDEVRPREG